MADDADRAQELIEREIQEGIRRAREKQKPSAPGDCDLCGEWSGRLVAGVCAPCRDKYRIK